MGLKLEEVKDFNFAEEFFSQTSRDCFTEIFPPDVAVLAKKTFPHELQGANKRVMECNFDS